MSYKTLAKRYRVRITNGRKQKLKLVWNGIPLYQVTVRLWCTGFTCPRCLVWSKPIAFGAAVTHAEEDICLAVSNTPGRQLLVQWLSTPAVTLHALDRLALSDGIAFGAVHCHAAGRRFIWFSGMIEPNRFWRSGWPPGREAYLMCLEQFKLIALCAFLATLPLWLEALNSNPGWSSFLYH